MQLSLPDNYYYHKTPETCGYRSCKMTRQQRIEELVELMKNPDQIRNVGIVAHIDHGKTSLADSLLANAGMLSYNLVGQARALDYLEEEQRRGNVNVVNHRRLNNNQGC